MTGLEPATSGVTGQHSNQLSYTPAKRRFMEPLTYAPAIELSSELCQELSSELCQTATFPGKFWFWKNRVLENQGSGKMVGGDGIEPPTLSV